MIKLIIFDLDDTLAPLAKGVSARNLQKIKEFEDGGTMIGVCSGKPLYYLCGFFRALELKRPILIGENGATIQISVDLPPKTLYALPYDKAIRHTFSIIKEEILDIFPDMYFQPNDVELTPFPKEESEFDAILQIIEKHKAELTNVDVYRNVDSFDFVPKGINKFSGLKLLCEKLNLNRDEVLTVGNGENDYPMFEFSAESVGINLKDKSKAKHNFTSIDSAIDFIEENYISK